MRKIFRLALFTTLILFIFTSSGFAKISEERCLTIYESEEIKDIDQLIQLAKNNITDAEEETRFQVALYNNITNELDILEAYRTTQKLKTLMYDDGRQDNYYATTTIVPLTVHGSKTKEDWDSSGGVKAYSTIYWYEEEVSSGGSYAVYLHLVSAEGGWINRDPRLVVENTKVIVAVNSNFIQKRLEKNVNMSFSISAPKDWPAFPRILV